MYGHMIQYVLLVVLCFRRSMLLVFLLSNGFVDLIT